MNNREKILQSLSAPTQSNWREKALMRKTNRQWLKRSQSIALAALERMNEIGISQKSVAKNMGVSAQYVSKVMKGSENLTLETISKLEEVLGISLIEVSQRTAKTAKLSRWNERLPQYSNSLLEVDFKTSTKTFVKYDLTPHLVSGGC